MAMEAAPSKRSSAAAMIPAIVRTRSMRKSSQQRSQTVVEEAKRDDSGTTRTSQEEALQNVVRRDHETSDVATIPASTRGSPPRRSGSKREPRPSEPTRTNSTSIRQPSRTADPVPGARRSAGRTHAAGVVKKRTTLTAQTGQWALGKTIGAGSMGKVKIARNMQTGEQVAVKIVPRQSTEEHRNEREKERADHSKEVRTAREAAIVSLLNHPYICAMRDVQRTGYHWYMLFEYVNGGQMLDYIISHGKLKEKQARKFGRQIVSALDYCHRNSIVHRDLKIENILISKLGDIKIIDFGLSNLYSPRSHLKTFCGSLYFAAPELLQARQYTGPEVDVWSLGIVLYVLVCGKVPFDDQSMPQLHAKIKRGIVEYPSWLSPECKHLISRMLTTDPKSRATLAEIMNHPWITKGYNTPPENFLPTREPLRLPLDPKVVDKMTGFDFGSADFITRELTKILSSEEYQTSNKQPLKDDISSASPSQDRKRGVFDFYRRRSSFTHRDLSLPGDNDSSNAFSPLISIYYLVREKQERERIETNPGALSLPIEPDEKLLNLPAPEAAHTNVSTFEMAGEKPTGGRARARSRTQGEEDFQPKPEELIKTPNKRETSGGLGLLRRFSTRRSAAAPPGPSVQVQPPTSLPHRTFSMRRARPPERPSRLHPGGSTPHQDELLHPPNGMSRSASASSIDPRRKQPPAADPPTTSLSSIGAEPGETNPTTNQSAENSKPVYLKGLFSVSTTSNKPLHQIRADIIRVLDQLSVSYHEIKGGFTCRHVPSIDLSPKNAAGARRTSPAAMAKSSKTDPDKRRLSISRKRFTLPDMSFTASSESESEINRSLMPRSPAGPETQHERQSASTQHLRPPHSPNDARSAEADPGGPSAGETTTQVHTDAAAGTVLKFEIFIVKVPLFNLHGIQFKKVQGGTWQYKEMASRILDALNL